MIGEKIKVGLSVRSLMAGALCEVKLNCLTLPTRASLWTMWALATTWEASFGAKVCQSITAARNRRSAATGVVISRVQLLVDAIAAAIDLALGAEAALPV